MRSGRRLSGDGRMAASCAALPVDVSGGGPVPVVASGFGAIDAGAPFDDIKIEFQNSPLAQHNLRHGDERELGAFAENGTPGSKEEILDELLRDGGPAPQTAALQVIFRGNFHGVPVEAVVLVKASVLRGDDGVLKIGRDL